ncbi:baeRF10 domain-containing protein [Deinococcus aquaticus]|uniref:baeRF10 domain-containing protein n=1 Tax=Deinococcus aquaticus TaxID=328692 RepID=UPI003F46002A
MPRSPATRHAKLDNTTLTLLQPTLPHQNVLSVVLDVNPGSAANQGGSLHLRAHQLLQGLGAPDALIMAVMDDLDDAQRRTRTRLSFLWDDHGHVQRQTVDTQLALEETSQYGTPDLEPLHFALESSARVLLAVIDEEWGRLLSVHLGEITELYRLENVLTAADAFRVHDVIDVSAQDAARGLDNVPVQHQGAQQDGRFRHALSAQIERLHRVGAFEQLLLGGSVRGRADLRAHLSPELQGTLAGEFAVAADATPAALLVAAHGALSGLQEQLETAVLDEAVDRGLHGGLSTLEAAQENRVAQLLLSAAGSARRVWQDASGYVYADAPPQGVSSRTGGGVTERSLRDVLPLLRERYGVYARFLTGARAERLDGHLEGVAGILRY